VSSNNGDLGQNELGQGTLGQNRNFDPAPLDGSSTADKLAARLPVYYPKDGKPGDKAGNFLLLEPIADQLDKTSAEMVEVDLASTVQYAKTIPQLQKLGMLVDVYPRKNEDIESYRARLIVRYMQVTAEGTIDDLIHAASIVFRIPKTSIAYDEQPSGSAILRMPEDLLEEILLSPALAAEELSTLMIAGNSLNIVFGIGGASEEPVVPEEPARGIKKFISVGEYQNDTYDGLAIGFDGLDANGEPGGAGGTFSSVF
jgi:hypothetical protein